MTPYDTYVPCLGDQLVALLECPECDRLNNTWKSLTAGYRNNGDLIKGENEQDMTQVMSVRAVDEGMIKNKIEIVELGEVGGNCVNSFTFLADLVSECGG